MNDISKFETFSQCFACDIQDKKMQCPNDGHCPGGTIRKCEKCGEFYCTYCGDMVSPESTARLIND